MITHEINEALLTETSAISAAAPSVLVLQTRSLLQNVCLGEQQDYSTQNVREA